MDIPKDTPDLLKVILGGCPPQPMMFKQPGKVKKQGACDPQIGERKCVCYPKKVKNYPGMLLVPAWALAKKQTNT